MLGHDVQGQVGPVCHQSGAHFSLDIAPVLLLPEQDWRTIGVFPPPSSHPGSKSLDSPVLTQLYSAVLGMVFDCKGIGQHTVGSIPDILAPRVWDVSSSHPMPRAFTD